MIIYLKIIVKKKLQKAAPLSEKIFSFSGRRNLSWVTLFLGRKAWLDRAEGGEGQASTCPRWKTQGMDYGLGAGFSLVSSFFSLGPQHFCIIWDITSAQLKGASLFFSIILLIISLKGIPWQQFLNGISVFF
jgi:hypothetical protein